VIDREERIAYEREDQRNDEWREMRRRERGLDTTTIGTLEATIKALRETNLRLENLLRAKDETIGELLGIVDERCDCGCEWQRYCRGCDL
jgi:hypothetical protein